MRFLAVALLILTSCSDVPEMAGPDFPAPDVVLDRAAPTMQHVLLENRLRADPDARTLMNVRRQMTARAVARRVTGVELTILKNNPQRLAARLGYTPAEIQDLDNRLKTAAQNVRRKFPEIDAAVATASSGDCCSAAPLAGYLNRRVPVSGASFLPLFQDPPPPEDDPCAEFEDPLEKQECYEAAMGDSDCDWFSFILCLVVCGSTNPIIYWPCAYFCICSFCEGGLEAILPCPGNS